MPKETAAMPGKTRISLDIDNGLLCRIARYRNGSHCFSRTEAIHDLIRYGLEALKRKDLAHWKSRGRVGLIPASANYLFKEQ